MTTFTQHPEYDALPESIKDIYSPEEYAWLSDEQRENLMELETCPEPDGVIDEDDGYHD